MPEWLWPIIIGGIVMGLIGVIYAAIIGRLEKLEKCKETFPRPDDLLTKSTHVEICKENLKPLTDLIIENRVIVLDSMKDFKENVLLKMENTLLKEIKKRNGSE